MIISYNWLCDYFPENLIPKPTPNKFQEFSLQLDWKWNRCIHILPFAEV